VEEFETDNLLRLLQTYETAIAELQKGMILPSQT